MKPNLFKYSVLTVGVVAAMSIAHAAQQPTGGTSAGSFFVNNQASATYMVDGNLTSQTAISNPVTITVNEQSSFTLLTDNVNKTINPKANSTANFTHILTNNGNVDDTYTLRLTNDATSGDDFDYSGYSVTYLLNNTGTAITVPITNGVGTISLPAKSAANITIVATADTARSIDKNGILTVSAESAYLKAKNPGSGPTITNTYTATNVDNAKTAAPLYAITKSASTNLGTINLDLNNLNAYVDYTITIKNEGNLDGKAVTIEDTLPNGLVAMPSTDANYTAPTIKLGTTAISVTPTLASNTITFAGVDIAVNETITVTFRAKKATGATSTSSFMNYAVVKDDTANDANANTPDITDRSDDATETTYENVVGGTYLGQDNNTQATVKTTNQTRAIAITPGANKEVALSTSGAAIGNTYSYTITNKGTDVTEAATAGSVLFSVKPTATGTTGITDNPKIEIARVFLDVDGDGIFNGTDVLLTGTRIGTTSEYTYDINQAKTSGFAPGAINAIKIGVEVVTAGSNSNAGGVGTSDIGKNETMTLTIVPTTVVNGTAIPTSTADNPLSTTSKTTMEGINLLKFQAVADCSTSLASIIDGTGLGNWSENNKNADVTQCLFYKIDAKNTFSTASGTNITSVAIQDTLVSSVTYRSDFTPSKAVTAPSQVNAPLIMGTFATLIPQETVTIKFSVKPSQSGTN